MTGKKVLIAEDEGIVTSDLRSYLTEQGYRISASVLSGEEAVKCCRSDPPDVALIDIGLQGKMGGIEAAKKIWGEMGIPVIFITGFADENTISRARRTNPEEILIKPIEEGDLERALEQVLRD